MKLEHKILSILTMGLSISLMYSNCGAPQALGRRFPIKSSKVVQIASHRQILPSLINCLNLEDSALRPATRQAARESASTLSLDGDASKISAPMMMALVKITGEVCVDLINQELAQTSSRKFFPGFELGTPANSQSYDLNTSIHRLATSCWGHEPSPSENDEIIKALTESNLINAKNRATALFLCTMMLGSGETFRR
ncbi:MAG: hypothetical protein K2Q26_03445 [Bdellovibrionales bacterium]|nr:hypothetical protein [Bdellovibrionales bacterium]